MPHEDPPPITVADLFDAPFTYAVPPYQRAYSWEGKHIQQFMADLQEHTAHKSSCVQQRPYYLGHFLFEGNSDAELFVIDGQQRLSTVVLLIGAVCRILRESDRGGEAEGLTRRFIEREGSIRFKTVRDDAVHFEDLVMTGHSKVKDGSRSQKRIQAAYNELYKHLKPLEPGVLLSLAGELAGAHVTRLKVAHKVQATQIFTLQNSRGKDLTEMEKLKAFLMYQVYLHSPENEENRAIEAVENQFEIIYSTAERLDYVDEDQVLRYFDRAFSPHWGGPVENLKMDLGKIREAPALIAHIRDFCGNLAATFKDVEKLESLLGRHDEIGDLVILSGADSWPLLIKLYHLYGNRVVEDRDLIELLQNAEITLLKFHFVHGRSSNDLVSYAKRLGTGEWTVEWLTNQLRRTTQYGFRDRADFSQPFLHFLQGDYHYHTISRYILWKYENEIRHPRDTRILPGEYLSGIERRSKEGTIEHIAPQTPGDRPYGEEFIGKYLHNVGNLLFMPRDLNSVHGNQSPLDKAALLAGVSFASHRAAAEQILAPCATEGCNEPWCGHKIERRKKQVVDFATERWRAAGTPEHAI